MTMVSMQALEPGLLEVESYHCHLLVVDLTHAFKPLWASVSYLNIK